MKLQLNFKFLSLSKQTSQDERLDQIERTFNENIRLVLENLQILDRMKEDKV